MDLLNNVYLGFSVAFIPINLLFCFIGVLLGTLVGVLPGLGPAATIALLLPITFSMRPETAIIMIAGIYYGAQYGGSTTSILVNIPGEASSVVTCLDGYQMARKGRAGPALGMSAFGSFIGGTLSVIGLMFLGPVMAGFALDFGPPEYFALMLLGIVILTFLSKGAMARSFVSAALGLFVGTMGTDPIVGALRYTYGTLTLMDGIGLVPVAMGLFGISEVLTNIESPQVRDVFRTKIKGLFPSRSDWKRCRGAIGRGSVLGFFLGILPGGGAILAAFTSYAIEKRISRHPEEFGKGAIEGVAGPETANNAATGGAMIPLLSLGIPSNVIMALLIGAMMIHGIKPSCFLINEHPQVFWGVITSMYLGNTLLLVLNLPLIPLWVRLLKIPYGILFPLIVLFCLIGVFTVNANSAEILVMLVFGAIGYVMRKTGFDPAPLLFAMVIGPIMETALRQSLLHSRGSFSVFLTRPIAAVLIVVSLVLLVAPLFPSLHRKRETMVKEGTDD